MKWAREYATIFRSGQYGKLYLSSGEHARGKTFHIWALPSDTNITRTPWYNKDAVEVYGILGGQPGWTEYYGWLHRGKWEQDFAELLEKRRVEIAAYAFHRKLTEDANQQEERQRVLALLATY